MQNLVIVESPTKARTLAKFLGSKYTIDASMGHIRDLPKSEMGVDIEHNFEPKYIIPRDKKKKANEIKRLAKEAQTIWLATDPDREGEAIAWHIEQLISKNGLDQIKDRDGRSGSKNLIKRVVFHEITKDAIKEAFQHPREINLQLVDAQQARRVLDRLVGYKLSPLLWKKVKRGLSAGRVQTVALRLIVEREKEIKKFVPVEYWNIEAELASARGPVSGQPQSTSSLASLTAGAHWDTPSTATPRTANSFFATLHELNGEKLEIHNQQEADTHVKNLESASYKISKVTKKEVRRSAPPPFTTSTLQQTAGNKFMFTAKKTMMIAQNLYEHGLISYMRTDSVNLSTQALSQTRDYLSSNFGQNYLPSSPRVFRSKSKNAQEAHEAIRPTNVRLQMSDIRNQTGFTKDHGRLYDLIWKRMVASQMEDAMLDQTSIDVEAKSNNVILGSAATPESKQGKDSGQVTTGLHSLSQARMTDNIYLLRATGSILKFDGWLRLYGVKQLEEEQEEQESSKKQVLPELFEGEDLNLLNLDPLQHFTQPLPRFTESSLIKKLEELGIGRPSTYAPILSTIQERFYVERQERKFVPTVLGFVVADFLLRYFPDLFDYGFTASMEDQLDEISRGERQWRETIGTFYNPFEGKLEKTLETAQHVKLPVEKVDKNCPLCGKQLVVRTGKFGKFLACSGFPECKHTQSFEQKLNIKCPKDGGEVVLRRTKKGRPFYGCKNYPKCDFASWTKPK